MSTKLIWEDTIHENCDKIIQELTNIENYATEDSESLRSISEAFSSKKFRDKLDENLKSLKISASKEDQENDQEINIRQVMKKRIK